MSLFQAIFLITEKHIKMPFFLMGTATGMNHCLSEHVNKVVSTGQLLLASAVVSTVQGERSRGRRSENERSRGRRSEDERSRCERSGDERSGGKRSMDEGAGAGGQGTRDPGRAFRNERSGSRRSGPSSPGSGDSSVVRAPDKEQMWNK